MGDTLVASLDLRGIAVSSGAACSSGSTAPSAVLTAMGDPEPEGALRISQGTLTTSADVEGLLAVLPEVLGAARRAAEAWD
jgi:cysteine desulfurase